MRTKNPAEEFGVAQYSDGRTGWEPARRPGRAGGRGFNGAVPVRPATSAGHPVPPGTSSCRPPGATAAGATLMYLHDTRSPRWSPQHKAIHNNGCHHLDCFERRCRPVKASTRGGKNASRIQCKPFGEILSKRSERSGQYVNTFKMKKF